MGRGSVELNNELLLAYVKRSTVHLLRGVWPDKWDCFWALVGPLRVALLSFFIACVTVHCGDSRLTPLKVKPVFALSGADCIRLAIGQSRLFLKKKMQQFVGLVDECERGVTTTSPTDLAGFWEMIYMQVCCGLRKPKLALPSADSIDYLYLCSGEEHSW